MPNKTIELSRRAFSELAVRLREAKVDIQFAGQSDGRLILNLGDVSIAAATDENERAEQQLWASSIFGHESRKGLVQLELNDTPGNAVTCRPSEARAFAFSILEAAESAETDQFIMEWLRERVGIKADTDAVQVLRDFRERREAAREREA